MLGGQVLDLDGLLVDDVGCVVQVVVNELLVGLVDEGSEEEDGGCDQRHAPKWNDLDQVV